MAADLRGALKPLAVEHMGALTDPKRVGDLLRAIAGYQGQPMTRAALQLHPLTGHGRYVFPSLLSGERPIATTP